MTKKRERHTNTTMKKLGIVGWGYWGRNYVKYLDTTIDAYLASVCDSRGEMLGDAKKRFPHLQVTTNANDLLRQNLDGVIIATPASTHYPLAKRFIEAGIPLLIEKPFTSSLNDARSLVQLAKKQGIFAMVGHTFLYNQAVRWLKEHVDQGYFGKLFYMECKRQSYGPIRDDVNVIWDFACHDLSIMTYLLDKQMPKTVFVKAKRYSKHKQEDIGMIILEYAHNILVTINVAWMYPMKIRSLTLLGKKRMAVFEDTNAIEPIKIYNASLQYPSETDPYGAAFRMGNVLIPRITPIDPLATQIKHFIACIKGEEKPFTPMEDGYANVLLLEALSQSLAQKKEIDFTHFAQQYV